MENPFCDGEQIRATQEAITYISEQRDVFIPLTSLAYTVGRVSHYAHDVLPFVTNENSLEFGLASFELWMNHDRQYHRIVRGVQFACVLVRSLRELVAQSALQAPPGELGPLVEEIRSLLKRERLARIPDNEIGGWLFRILRLDQVFRLHEKDSIDRLLSLVYEIDALIALADVTRENDFILPEIEQGPLRVNAEDIFHPLLQDPVANPAKLDQAKRLLFLTGPNMAGKTTYLRSFATALYFAHLGMGVPASSFSFVPAERLFSSISLSDDLQSGISYFRAEALRVKTVAQAVADGYRVVALMDEPFKGTNVKDALDASRAMIERFSTKRDCLFMFSSHLIELSEHLDGFEQIACRNFEAEESDGRLRFEYQLRPGVSGQRLGMRVLREEGIFDLLDEERD
jgi:hypothetical protein